MTDQEGVTDTDQAGRGVGRGVNAADMGAPVEEDGQTRWAKRWHLERLVATAIDRWPFLVVVVLLLGLWELLSVLGFMSPLVLPPPSDIAAGTLEIARSGELWENVIASTKRVAIGFLLASVVGVSVGVILGSNRMLDRAFYPLVEMLRPIPPIAWIPLAIVWFGIGDPPSYFIVFLGAVFPIFLNTYVGVGQVDPTLLSAARMLDASPTQISLMVRLPAGIPFILTGLRIGLGIGWMAVVAAELVAARSGLGFMIQIQRQFLRTDLVIVGMLAIGVLGQFTNVLMRWAERRLAPWQEKTD